jgi:ribonuclease-3
VHDVLLDLAVVTPAKMNEGFDELRARLRPFIEDEDLVRLALTHRSYCAENAGSLSNERLEFLGDSVLGIVVTEELYRNFPELREGDLARIRADVVSAVALAPLARELGIGEALFLGNGEDNSGGREKPSLLADALEAVMGAIFISSGIDRATTFVRELTSSTIAQVSARSVYGDAKNRLQELAAKRHVPSPVYRVHEIGPDHQKRFVAEVSFDGEHGRGEGHSKKEAERQAAFAVLEALDEPGA